MMQRLNSCGNFDIRKDDAFESDSVWLYWLDKPIKHLTNKEFGDLELLMKTTKI